MRLEDHVDLPLGTVLVDLHGVTHVFIGIRRNSAGFTYYFQPEVSSFHHFPHIAASYALVPKALARFPDLEKYRK